MIIIVQLPFLTLLSPCKYRSMGRTIGIRQESQGLYHLSSTPSSTVCTSMGEPLLVHRHLGHLNISKLQKMVSRFSSLSSLECESCQLGKHTRVSFPKRFESQTKSPFELVPTNVYGVSRTASTLGFLYFVTFIDDFFCCTWLFLIKSQTKLFSMFQNSLLRFAINFILLFASYAMIMP